MRDRREEGTVGFHQQPVLRNGLGNRLQVLGILEGYDSRQRDRQAQIEDFLAELRRGREAMDERGKRPLPHLVRQDGERILLGIARMDDEREVRSSCDRDVEAKQALLHGAVGMLVVIVEPRFADTDDAGVLGRLEQRVFAEVLMVVRVMRVDTDARIDIGGAMCGLHDLIPLAPLGRDIEERTHTGRSRAIENGVLIFDQALIFKMAMAIDQHYAASASGRSRRGN